MFNNKNKKDYFRKRDFANPNFFNSNESGDKQTQQQQQTQQRGEGGSKDKDVPSLSRNDHIDPPESSVTSFAAAGNPFVTAQAEAANHAFNPLQVQQEQQQIAAVDGYNNNKAEATAEIPTDEAELEIAPHLHKHPLQNTWTLWYLENDRTKTWEEMQNEITSFDTVEDFWSLYNHIKTPSELKIGCDYSLFKKDIRPMWEDAANKQGGRWVITLNKNCKDDLDNIWLDIMLVLIGENFANNEELCGAVVNIRSKSNKISIWTANGNNKEAALEIGYKLRDALHLRPQNLQYQLHKDTMIKQGSAVKSIYVL